MWYEIKVRFWQMWKKYVLRAFQNEREPYHMGFVTRHPIINTEVYLGLDKVDPSVVDGVETVLISLGYQPNYFSFGDKGQITSMRKMYVAPDGTWRQWHVRVHEDGEVRGHDELSYEESAIAHLDAKTLGQIPLEEQKRVMDVL